LRKHRPGRDTQVHFVTLIVGLIAVFGVYFLGAWDDGGSEETELTTFGTHVGFLQGQLVCELATMSLAVSVISMRPNLPPDSRPTFILPHPGPRKRKRKRRWVRHYYPRRCVLLRYRTSAFLWEKKATTQQNRELNKGMVKFKNKSHSAYVCVPRHLPSLGCFSRHGLPGARRLCSNARRIFLRSLAVLLYSFPGRVDRPDLNVGRSIAKISPSWSFVFPSFFFTQS
jgi:hypothetical protein